MNIKTISLTPKIIFGQTKNKFTKKGEKTNQVSDISLKT